MTSQNPQKQTILFDLDQTIIPYDTQLLVRSYILRKEPLRILLTPLFLLALPFAKFIGTQGMKRLFHSYLWLMPQKKLQSHVENFVADWLPKITYPEIITQINTFKSQNAHLILSSASPEIWVKPIAQALGFDQAHGTLFDWPTRTPLLPKLLSPNHKGIEKITRLRAHGINQAQATFSDSRADLPLLLLAQQQFLVNPLPVFETFGLSQNWTILTPPTPWKNRPTFALHCALQLFGLWKP